MPAMAIPSSECVMAGEEWHDDRYSVHWRYCCDHAPLGPVERKSHKIKRALLFQVGPVTAKKPRGY